MADPSGMGVEAMRPKVAGKLAYGGKGPKPKHPRNSRGKLKRGHKIKKFTKRMKRA